MHTSTQDPVSFYTQSGAAHGGLAPVASGQTPPAATTDARTLLQKIQMLPAQPYQYGTEAYGKAQATKAERMKRALGLGFVIGVIAEAVHQYRQTP